MTTHNKTDTVDTGLYGIAVSRSSVSVSTKDENGAPLVLYRGYNINDLVKGSFEEAVYLILNDELPNEDQLKTFSDFLKKHGELPPQIVKHLRTYPKQTNRMDLLLTALSYTRIFDADYENLIWRNPKADHEKQIELLRTTGIRLGAKIPTIIAYANRIANGEEPVPPNRDFSYAGNLLHMLGLDCDEESVRALDTSLILYLDHTINNSTFLARVAESAKGDPYGPLIAAGVGLKGVLHGGANELAADMIEEIGTPENAEKYVLDKMANRESVFGFGHRLPNYKGQVESRVAIARNVAESLLKKKGLDKYLGIYKVVTETMSGDGVEERKRRSPNLDLPTCLIYKALGIQKGWNTPIFQASRHFGWLAHMIEQRENLCPLYRPTQIDAEEIEEAKKYVPIDKR